MNKKIQSYEQLQSENETLKAKLKSIEDSKKRRNKTVAWLGKKAFGVFIGRGLKNAIQQTINDFNETKRISSENLSNVLSHIIWRLTRVGIIGILIALVPSALLGLQTYYLNIQNKKIDNQNVLIQHQNSRLDQQIHLQEAGRRSTYVYLFANVMEAMDNELKEEGNQNRDLSDQLIGRIISLSKSLKPYKYLEGDNLSAFKSPERSQLFMNLVNAGLSDETYLKIFNQADFDYIELWDTTISNIPFGYLRIDNALLQTVEFVNCSFRTQYFNNLVSREIVFSNCNFSNLAIKGAQIGGLLFRECNFREELIISSSKVRTMMSNYSLGGTLDISNTSLRYLEMRTSFYKEFKLDIDENNIGDILRMNDSRFNNISVSESIFLQFENPKDLKFNSLLLNSLLKDKLSLKNFSANIHEIKHLDNYTTITNNTVPVKELDLDTIINVTGGQTNQEKPFDMKKELKDIVVIKGH